MRRCYTIPSYKALSKLPSLDVAQFTLNSRTFPSKRNTVEALKEMLKTTSSKIIVHYDFIYIVSRYIMFRQSVREAIVNEVASIMKFSKDTPQIIGIVMHMDFPIKREAFKVKDSEGLKHLYGSNIWDSEASSWIDKPGQVVEQSVQQFVLDLSQRVIFDGACPVFLENTTKTFNANGTLIGSASYVKELLIKHSAWNDVLGFCLDTEHAYAVEGDVDVISTVKEVQQFGYRCLVHVNAIPGEVLKGSFKDRHSETTLFDCSVHNFDYYKELTDSLDSLEVPWVREVHTNTMFSEIQKLESLGL